MADMRRRLALITSIPLLFVACGSPLLAQQDGTTVLTGKSAFGDWREDKPGLRRHIRAEDLPLADLARSSSSQARIVSRPADRKPIVPAGFEVSLFASGLDHPRLLRTAPNGDVFVAESNAGRITVLRPAISAGMPTREVFASGLRRPFGISFFPAGPDPQWVYIANTDSVIRFPYRNGDTKARGKAEVVVPKLPSGSGHWTRDVVFSADGKKMFVSVGSGSNVGEEIERRAGTALQAWTSGHPLGAVWEPEIDRADVLAFDPEGGTPRIFATGIRNCVSMAITPENGDLWCSTNERDGIGHNVPPDYITRVREGAFYGWPWYYIGGNEDPRLRGERPDLKDKITVPDVLIQAHSASLGMTFYEGTQFPAEYRGNIFAAEHGSWNRGKRTGYKIIRVIVKDGIPTGEYEDFVTGFVVSDGEVWGRPVGVAIDKDGALLISEDGGGTIWRVTHQR
jgi:glucose/arabinose dehydrogenase